LGNILRAIFLLNYADIYSRKMILVSIAEQGGALMDITRVAAISPVIRINSFKSKDFKKDDKSREGKKGKDFEKTLKSKQ